MSIRLLVCRHHVENVVIFTLGRGADGIGTSRCRTEFEISRVNNIPVDRRTAAARMLKRQIRYAN